jgi:hypothetical protein
MSPTPGNLLYQIKNAEPSVEPAVKVGITFGTVTGAAALVTYFFPDIPDSTIQGALVVAAFLLPIINAFLTRGRVWSPDSVQIVINEAVDRALEQANKNKLDKSLGLRKATPDQDDNPYSGK